MFKQIEVTMEKPIDLGIAVLELIEILMHETKYDKLQANLGEKIIQCQYIDTEAFVLSLNTNDKFSDFYNFFDLSVFSLLTKDQERFLRDNGRRLVTSNLRLRKY